MCQLDPEATGGGGGQAVSVNERNGRGQTPLQLAAAAGNAAVARVLLDHGAARAAADAERRTPLHCAAAADDADAAAVARELCRDAPPVSRSVNHNDDEELSDSGSTDDDDDDFVNQRNSDGKTALHLATGAGKLQMIQVTDAAHGLETVGGNLRRILVMGVNAALPPEAKKIPLKI